jgi:hypothetical protein
MCLPARSSLRRRRPWRRRVGRARRLRRRAAASTWCTKRLRGLPSRTLSRCSAFGGSSLQERAPQEPPPARRHPLRSNGCTGPAFTKGRPRNHHQPGDTPCSQMAVHSMSDTRARVPEPKFPAGPAAPTVYAVPGAMVSPRPPASLGLAPSPRPGGLSGTLWRTAGRPGRGLSSRDPLRGRYRSGAQPDLVVNCLPQLCSTVLQDEPCRTAMDDP